ncbi:sensor domain-containing diguanylate cyclase [Mycolicibacterium chubuense]|uniref:Putative diguanylate cyclase YegE n=1 Tax=Mycolicibacterium chubuense TaxID=1800 RepID=A0A0J6ZEZ3_MYCCU|nr:sensor domain-containing diguanylate cyclase [Mycolicibacterium chubuense]KMO83371.1 putative diguanylate cyclase YegE [Mycolicibacterium chubuense]ORA47654.1 sensor domain-containing diguanylate cyclase [Mycolicibacterium chubuense]SPY00375.1 PAS domain S-box/diguanylate cyclase (GGDEF) domain-containing protein [Mycolicibacterium chubuense]
MTPGASPIDGQSPIAADNQPPHFSDSDYVRGMTRLTDVIQELSLSRTASEVQRIVASTAREMLGCDGATVVIRDRDMCFYADEDAVTPLWKGRRFPMEACVSGWVMVHKQPAVIPDIYADERVPHDAYRPTFVKSLAMVPIRRRDPVGALGAYWAQRRRPTQHELALLQALADVTSVAMENVRAHAVLEQQIEERPTSIDVAMPSAAAPGGLDATFAAAFANAPIGMAVIGLDGSFQKVNREFCRIAGYEPEDLTRLTFQDITHPDDLDIDLAEASRLLAGEIASYQMDKRYYSRDGHVVWVRLSVFLVHDDSGEPQAFISHIEDISARRRDEELLRRQATLDTLTGVYNRNRFEEELRRYKVRASRHANVDEAAVFMIDLDGLKQVNDQHGHSAGDAYLRNVADIISRRLRLSDVLARIGGDEFAVLLPRTTLAQAQQMAQTLVERVEALSPGTICIGIAMLTPDAIDEALERADRAMYRAKRQGGSHWCGPEATPVVSEESTRSPGSPASSASGTR